MLLKIITYQLFKYFISHIIGSIFVTFYMVLSENESFNKYIAYSLYLLFLIPSFVFLSQYI